MAPDIRIILYRRYSMIIILTGLSLLYGCEKPTEPNPPAAPSNLQVISVTIGNIGLSWTDNSGNERGFYIERSLFSSSGYTRLAGVGANTTEYTNTGLDPSTSYFYRVNAYNNDGSSGYSNIANATTFEDISDPFTPTDLQAVVIEGTSISLTWTDNSADEVGFIIEQSLSSSGGFSEIDTVGANETTCIIDGLSLSTAHYFRVCAYYSEGRSDYSGIVLAVIGTGSKVGDVATDFTAKDMYGNDVSLSDYLGEVILINVSADW